MNKEQAIVALPLVKALSEGKTIQYDMRKYGNQDCFWVDCKKGYFSECPNWIYDSEYHRIKPEPKLVPWTMEDVPADCWVKVKASFYKDPLNLTAFERPIYIGPDGIRISTSYDFISFSYLKLKEEFEYSTDLKTWKPCGKEVVE